MNSTGHVTWIYRALVETFCEVNMRYFPFDEQICYIAYGTFDSDSSLVDLESLQNHTSDQLYVENELILITDNRIFYNQESLQVLDQTFTYSRIVIELTMKRVPYFYVLNIIVPCVVLSLISLFAFCLPRESGERVTFFTDHSFAVLYIYSKWNRYGLHTQRRPPPASAK